MHALTPTRSRLLRGALSLLLAGMALAAPAAARAAGLVVVPRPSGAGGRSYFKLYARPGSWHGAGSIELRNPTSAPIQVRLDPVDGLTLSTLGSGYAPPGSAEHGATTWVTLARRLVTLRAHARLDVPVLVKVPAGAGAGDFLSGVSVEALGQGASSAGAHRGVSIASASRYAIGVEVTVPGPRRPLITFSGASIERQPAGLTFLLHAENTGNVVLQGVHGRVVISRAGRPVLSRQIEAGAFISGTSIAYPVTAFHQFPPEGTAYRISAFLRYAGGEARLADSVTFGHHEAAAQQHYGHTPAAAPRRAWWPIAGVALVALYALMTTALLVRRRSREGRPAGQT